MKLKFLPFTMMTVSAIAMTLVACQTSVPPTQNVTDSSLVSAGRLRSLVCLS